MKAKHILLFAIVAVLITAGCQRSAKQKSGEAEITFSENPYGYTYGEWEMKLIHVAQGAKKGEVDFHIHIEESGKDEIIIDIQGTAKLKGSSFRYKESGYEFEITAHKGYITLKTISGDLNGYKADGEYPEIITDDTYMVN